VWGTMVVMVLIHRVPSILPEGSGRSTRPESWVGPWRSSSLGEGIPPPQARAPTPLPPWVRGTGPRGTRRFERARAGAIPPPVHVRATARTCTGAPPRRDACSRPLAGPWRAPDDPRDPRVLPMPPIPLRAALRPAGGSGDADSRPYTGSWRASRVDLDLEPTDARSCPPAARMAGRRRGL